MKAAAFDYSRPTDWPEALQLLQAGARPAAGTQSLGPMLNFRLSLPQRLADLRHLPGYTGVTLSNHVVRIGAGTTHAAIEDGAVPGRLGAILAAIASRIAYRAIRNRGTIGGSLAHADPAADWVATLPALDATAIAIGPQGERRIPAAAFVLGLFTTALAENELLQAIELPTLPETARWGHWKFCRKPGEFSRATACILHTPGHPPKAVLAALDAPPLMIPDPAALLADPAITAARIVAPLKLDPWRAAIARTALCRAVQAL